MCPWENLPGFPPRAHCGTETWMPWEKQSPDFMHWLTVLSALWLTVSPSSAVPLSYVIDYTFLPFRHNYFLILHNTCFSFMNFRSEVKYWLCIWNPTDSFSFCTKLAQDQLASKKFFPSPLSWRKLDFMKFDIWPANFFIDFSVTMVLSPRTWLRKQM